MLEMSCVDHRDVKQRVPVSVTSVPTLVIVSEGRVLVGLSDIGPWLRSQLMTMKKKKSAASASGATLGTADDAGDPNGTCDGEWGASYSDSYSFIESATPLTHSYASAFEGSFSVGATDKSTTPQFKSREVEHASGRNSDVSHRMEQFIADRDKDLRT